MLPEAGYDTASTEHTVQITDTQILGSKVINETHFQYLRDNSQNQTPLQRPSPVHQCAGGFYRWRQQCGNADRPSGSLRTAELHFDIAGKQFVKVWRPSAGSPRSQHVRALGSTAASPSRTFTTYHAAVQALASGDPTAPAPLQFRLDTSRQRSGAQRARHRGRCRTRTYRMTGRCVPL